MTWDFDLLPILRKMVLALDCKHGVTTDMYIAVGSLIYKVMGEPAEAVFVNSIDASEDHFYFKNSTEALECWEEMMREYNIASLEDIEQEW